MVAEWQGCLKLFDCSDQGESANLGLKLESKFFSAKSGFFALLNAKSWWLGRGILLLNTFETLCQQTKNSVDKQKF